MDYLESYTSTVRQRRNETLQQDYILYQRGLLSMGVAQIALAESLARPAKPPLQLAVSQLVINRSGILPT